MQQPIRKLIAGAVVTVMMTVTAVITTTIPNPTPGATPTVITTTKPTTVPVQTAGPPRFDRPAKYIVGHHQGGTAWTNPSQAKRWFVEGLGYADVAYNVMITPAGAMWQGRGEQYTSAATYGLNGDSVAFCWLGNLDKAWPTDAQLVAAAAWVKAARVRHPGAVLIGHKDVARVARDPSVATGCPGKAAIKANSLRAVWLLVCGYSLPEAKRRAAAGL